MTKTQKSMTLISAVSIQLCLGIAYLWSLFQTGIAETLFNGNATLANLNFSILLLVLTLTSPIGGKISAKYSIKVSTIIGGFLLFIGFFSSKFITPSTSYLLWITYGVIGGAGMGMIYAPSISCVQKCYPEKKGFVTGIVVAGLGFGGFIFTPIIEVLIKKFGGVGVGEYNTFMIISFIFLAVCIAGAFFLKSPKEQAGAQVTTTNDEINYTPGEMIKTPAFYLVFLIFTLSVVGGLMVIGFAKPIAVSKGLSSAAAVGLLIISLCNSSGRLFWGVISDKIGSKNTLMILLGISTISISLVNFVSGYWIFVFFALISFCFGGYLSNIPTLTAKIFGINNMATNYGIILIGFGIGAVVASNIGGYYRNLVAAQNDLSLMFPAFLFASICALVALGLVLILGIILKKQR